MQAVRAVNHILGRQDGIRFDIMPAAIFTDPEAACVGPSEDELKANGVDFHKPQGFLAGQRQGNGHEPDRGYAEAVF